MTVPRDSDIQRAVAFSRSKGNSVAGKRNANAGVAGSRGVNVVTVQRQLNRRAGRETNRLVCRVKNDRAAADINIVTENSLTFPRNRKIQRAITVRGSNFNSGVGKCNGNAGVAGSRYGNFVPVQRQLNLRASRDTEHAIRVADNYRAAANADFVAENGLTVPRDSDIQRAVAFRGSKSNSFVGKRNVNAGVAGSGCGNVVAVQRSRKRRAGKQTNHAICEVQGNRAVRNTNVAAENLRAVARRQSKVDGIINYAVSVLVGRELKFAVLGGLEAENCALRQEVHINHVVAVRERGGCAVVESKIVLLGVERNFAGHREVHRKGDAAQLRRNIEGKR